MKHIVALLLIFSMLLSMAGCSATGGDRNPAPTDETMEPTSGSPAVEDIPVANLTMCIGDRYYEPFSIEAGGDAEISVSREGIIEIIGSELLSEDLYYMDFQAMTAGETTLSVTIDRHRYQFFITVEAEPAVYVPEGELGLEISVDKTDAVVYVDDTTVTYTVVTAPAVDRLVFEQLASPSAMPSYNYVISGQVYAFALAELTVDDGSLTDTPREAGNQTVYTAQKEQRDGKLYWTVTWDLGYTAASIIRISAYDSASGLSHEGYVHLNITYPVFDPSQGLESIALFWLERNTEEPLLFTVDTGKLTQQQQFISDTYDKAAIFESEAFMMTGLYGEGNLNEDIYYLQSSRTPAEYYDLMFQSSPLYHMGTTASLSQYGLVSIAQANDPNNAEIYPQFQGKNRLVSNCYQEDVTYIFHGDLTAAVRAVMAYLHGFEIDETVFPYAHSILQQGSGVIEGIITDGMTDFEKEKAIYDWMIENYNGGLAGLNGNASKEHSYYVTKTAYGLLNGYHGDCAGWSSTFFTLCSMAGLSCGVLDVRAEPGGAVELTDDFSPNHQINILNLEGEYYFVEVFWFYQKHSPEDGDYRYMNMTTAQAAAKYTWLSEEFFGPMEFDSTSFLVDAQTGELLNP